MDISVSRTFKPEDGNQSSFWSFVVCSEPPMMYEVVKPGAMCLSVIKIVRMLKIGKFQEP